MTLEEYAACDGHDLAALVRRGEVTAKELAVLARAASDRVNPHLNAVIEIFDDVIEDLGDGALPSGPFVGVPTLIKDFPAMAGRKAEFGCELAKGFTPRQDSSFWRKLRDAGAVTIGRTTSSELGLAATTENRLNGRTCNPWDVTRSVAGSSGGAAAAVAAGIVPVAQGGDGGGSIRTPASYCGLVGLKPSRGRVSGAPMSNAPLSGLGIAFMLTRSVRDCAALLDCMHGPVPGDYYEVTAPAAPFVQSITHRPAGLRVALVTESWSDIAVESEVKAGVLRAAAALSERGHHIVDAQPRFDYARFLEAQKIIWCAHESRSIAQLAAATGRQPGPQNLQATSWAVYLKGQEINAGRLLDALAVYEEVTRYWGEFFEAVDVLVTPTCPIAPEKLGTYDPDAPGATVDDLFDQLAPKETFTALFNGTGQPAISLPLEETGDGLPVGIQFVARFGAEATLLGLAAELEECLPWRSRRPRVHVAHV